MFGSIVDEMIEARRFGKTFEAHGRKWLYVQELPSGYVLAVEIGVPAPAPTYVVKPEVPLAEQWRPTPAPTTA